jgi:acyl-CoA synthetase (AMP-forming)/AMP-acid ligase II
MKSAKAIALNGVIVDSIARLASSHPRRIAVIRDCGKTTFAELDGHARRMAGWLAGRGLHPGGMVGITLQDEYDHLVTCLALMYLGCSQITLAHNEPPAMRSALASRCRVSCVITNDMPCGQSTGDALIPDFEEILADGPLGDKSPGHNNPEAVVLLPSSGTTGRPKIIPCTQEQLFRYGLQCLPELSVILGPASIESNVGKWSHLANLARGRTLVFRDPLRSSLAETCRRHGVTLINLAPSQALSLLREFDSESEGPAFDGVRFSVGGAPVPGALRQEIQRRLTGSLFVLYGATECGNATEAGPETHADHPDSTGRPLPGIEIGIVDDAGRALPAGEPGFIRIRGGGCATGYFDDEEASARAFRAGWFHPGDMGRLTADGMLIFSGRGDDMMVLNTINIFPAEIEAVAAGFPGIRDCAAFPLRSEAYGDIPMLAVVPGEGFDSRALLDHCRERLGTRSPRKIVHVDHIPRNAMGKVMRRELAKLGGAS